MLTDEEVEMKRLAWLLKIVRGDARVLWFALRQPNRPAWLVPSAALLTLYALAPFNIALPLVGVVDDGIVVPVLLHLMVACLPVGLRRAAR
ncbi:MAG: hypothetical protein V4793_18150 [Paraburkholderia tropica]|nr:hypothetical protein [Paraburkholderia tropica]MBB2999845.1 uncharacterized membrane protein YkvA (DUF1232 family) [Paraburkholderia tropica]MBB6319476.1 uncharacterized membrane protein YkvA (DUF1232 family) [Paraburkholderia tropica]MDE1142801.1 hypothetical protein [Paraburkholderia tropica]